ncbi:MAG: nickel pincer cofactor biosynthesis protein LarB [Candidatus Omnitrophica bacterium]|nr:nickel pincer cofactor biosynthesis protein LarB [Candidatus Omnitrophota bacterium]
MDTKRLKKLLQDIKSGKKNVASAMRALKSLPFEDLGFAKVDTHRDLRCGFSEVVFCQGKTLNQVTTIVKKLSLVNSCVLATKADKKVYRAIKRIRKNAVYYEQAKIVVIGKNKKLKSEKTILVVSAGTSDIPVAEEAAVTAMVLGNKVQKVYDVGVAGVHRLLKHKQKLFKASVIIVVAGMEGALASIVGGLVDKPVIAVPTSVGYGASFKGLSALLTMLNCCAPGITVVNIDNGFGAGYAASIINRQ